MFFVYCHFLVVFMFSSSLSNNIAFALRWGLNLQQAFKDILGNTIQYDYQKIIFILKNNR